MKKTILLLGALLCCLMSATEAYAQESVEQALKKAEEKAQLADKNPTNGKMQYEAAIQFINDDLGEKKDLDRALTYAHRALKIAMEQPVLKDTLKGLSCYALGLIYIKKQSAENAADFMEMAMDAFEQELGKDDPVTNGTKLIFSNLVLWQNALRGFPKLQEAFNDNSTAPERKRITNMDEANVVREIGFEMVLAAYTNQFRYALPVVTYEGKSYLVLQTRDWNMERPLVGWMQPGLMRSPEEEKTFVGDDIILCDEDSKFLVIPAAEREKVPMTFNFRHRLANPRHLESDEGDSRILFFNPEAHGNILAKFREFKAKK